MQVTRFIKKGYTFLATGRNDLLAAISPDNSELVIVMLNTGTDEKKVDIDLSLLKSVSDKATLYVTNSNLDCEKMADLSIVDKTLSYEMGGQEIATAILSVNAGDGVQGIQKNIPYMIVPRVGSSVIKKVGDGLQLAVFSPSDKLQQWIFEPLSNGKYTISLESDGKRLAMTDNGSYYLALTELKENDPSQQFELLSIGDDCYKLKSASNEKLFDLEGEATTVNTKVGLWQAGATGANAHREWYILPVPFAQEDSENVSVTELTEEDNVYFYSEESLLKMIHLSGKPLNIAVYNLSGTLLYSKADVTNRSLEISLPKGVYLVKCTSMQKRSTMKVVVR